MSIPFVSPGRVASSVELVSNAVMISGADIGQAGYMIQPGKFPQALLPSVLHETTHWDTFATPVGQALSTLFLRAWRGTQHDKIDEFEVSIDYTRYKCFTEIFRPLCEGLALFSEFDLVPGSSPVTTTPTLLAGQLWNWLDGDTSSLTVGQLAGRQLANARLHALFRSRKENLLSSSFSTLSGGYLPGYFLVKALRNYLLVRRKFVSLYDGDLFSYVIRAVIFGDIRLARLIIDPALDLMFSTDAPAVSKDAINAGLIRFQDRLQFLLHDLDRSFVEKLERIIGAGSEWHWTDLTSGSDLDTIEEDVAVLEDSLSGVLDGGDSPNVKAQQAARRCGRFLQNRELLCLASFDCLVNVNEHGRCLVKGALATGEERIFLSVPALSGIKTMHGNGTFEIYYDRNLLSLFGYSVVIGEQCVACGSYNAAVPFDQDSFASRQPALAASARRVDEMTKDVMSAVSEYPIYEHYALQIGEITTSLYGQYCLGFFELYGRPKDLDDNINILDSASDDFEFLSDYVALSLVNSGIFVDEELEAQCKSLSVDFDVFKKKLKHWLEAKKIPLYDERGGLVTFTL